jgi:hypothetical protein
MLIYDLKTVLAPRRRGLGHASGGTMKHGPWSRHSCLSRHSLGGGGSGHRRDKSVPPTDTVFLRVSAPLRELAVFLFERHFPAAPDHGNRAGIRRVMNPAAAGGRRLSDQPDFMNPLAVYENAVALDEEFAVEEIGRDILDLGQIGWVFADLIDVHASAAARDQQISLEE